MSSPEAEIRGLVNTVLQNFHSETPPSLQVWSVVHLGIHSPGKFITDILHRWAQEGDKELWIHFSYRSTGGGIEHVIVSFLPIQSPESSEDDSDGWNTPLQMLAVNRKASSTEPPPVSANCQRTLFS